jgi:hypothetical protein
VELTDVERVAELLCGHRDVDLGVPALADQCVGLDLASDIHCETRPGETFRSEGGERLETLQHRRNVARARARRLADH